MSLYCDYDSLTHYQPGEFASKYAENLEGKLELTKKDTSLKDTEVDSFLHGNYDTFITKSPIVLYSVNKNATWTVFYYDAKAYKSLRRAFDECNINNMFDVEFIPSEAFWDQ